MRQGNLVVIALCILFFLNGTGASAMVQCQSQNHPMSEMQSQADLSAMDADHQHHKQKEADVHTAAADPCNTMGCDLSCPMHCALIPALLPVALSSSGEKVASCNYTHTDHVILPQKRPPKTV